MTQVLAVAVDHVPEAAFDRMEWFRKAEPGLRERVLVSHELGGTRLCIHVAESDFVIDVADLVEEIVRRVKEGTA